MRRDVKTEMLDVLPPDDLEATKSRRDLRRLNWLMGHARILGRLLEEALPARVPARIVEFGAGDGGVMLSLARRFARRWPNVQVILVDKCNVVTDETRDAFSKSGWQLRVVEADIFEWVALAGQRADAIICNLFLHHFTDERLVWLFDACTRRTDVFVAAEPHRAEVSRALSRFAGLIGCGPVTRHDIVLSVQAGFAEHELSALWPADGGWILRENAAGLFTHIFLAVRQDALERSVEHWDGISGSAR